VRPRFPLIVLNFKTYSEALGVRAVELARAAERVSGETGVEVMVCPPLTELKTVASQVGVGVLAQHCDPYDAGPYTGAIVAEALKEAGAVGSLLNHSERKMRLNEISAALGRLRDNGLISLVCADDPNASAAVSAMGPEIVAVEPPELIGTGISVSTSRPEVVSDTVRRVRSVNPGVHVLCGAGVSKPEDVSRALQLGAEGVLVSSAYVKSRDPAALLREMCRAALL
jgi:triosephosphate isomerase